jgi:hypothetical protein
VKQQSTLNQNIMANTAIIVKQQSTLNQNIMANTVIIVKQQSTLNQNIMANTVIIVKQQSTLNQNIIVNTTYLRFKKVLYIDTTCKMWVLFLNYKEFLCLDCSSKAIEVFLCSCGLPLFSYFHVLDIHAVDVFLSNINEKQFLQSSLISNTAMKTQKNSDSV